MALALVQQYLVSIVFLFFVVENVKFVKGISSETEPEGVPCNGESFSKWLSLLPPESAGSPCQYTIKPYSSNVCQLRIDFTTSLGQPQAPEGVSDGSPICSDSYLEYGYQPLRVCGVNTKQHSYIVFNGAITEGEIINVVPGSAINPYYEVNLTQIECSTDLVAPRGCAQYYTESSGIVKSFNYNNGNGPHPGNMQYIICFQKPNGASQLQLTGVHFQLRQNDPTVMIDDPCFNYETNGADTDWIFVWPLTFYCENMLQGETINIDMEGRVSIIFNAGTSISPLASSQCAFQFEYAFI